MDNNNECMHIVKVEQPSTALREKTLCGGDIVIDYADAITKYKSNMLTASKADEIRVEAADLQNNDKNICGRCISMLYGSLDKDNSVFMFIVIK